MPPQRIILTSEVPIACQPYRASPRDNAEIKSQLDALLKVGIIKPSNSPYAAPITLAYKRDDNARTRLCVDYRKINAVTKKDSEPIPRIDQVLDQLTSAKIFSKIDLTAGFWHVNLDERDTEKLAFTSNFGLFEWSKLPFGWRNSPSIFSRAIRRILNKHRINYAINYFDDIIIYSNSYEEHLEHLKHFFQICEKENLKLKLSKCEFTKDQIDFLGYEIKNGQYSPANPNIEIIKKLKPPKTVKELQRFLGSINVYNKFIPEYAKIRAPLNQLLKKDVKFIWSDKCQSSFELLKNLLISKPILTLYNPNLYCHLLVDASGESVSAVLKQEHSDGILHPVAFHSRKLKSYEKNYTISELECLAIIDAIDKFYCYLHGNHFTIHTDHAALVWLKKIKKPTGRLFRWSLKLSMFDFDIKYKKGSANIEADMLTRNEISLCNTARVHLLDTELIKTAQENENLCDKKYLKFNQLLTIKKQSLYKIVVPFSLRQNLLETAHNNYGHLGISSMLNLISPLYYWPGIINDVKNFVRHCEICQKNKKPREKKYGLLEEMTTSSTPFEILSLDSVGGLSSYISTKNYLHIVVDHATRYIWTFPSKSVSTNTYINCLKQIFQIQTPKKLLTDRNAAFTSSTFKHFLKKYNITQLLTSPHRPQTNGKNERANQTLLTRLRCKINDPENYNISWPKLLIQVTEEYNNTPHSITKFPPNYLMYGNLPYKLPIDQNLYPPVEEARKLAEERTKSSYISTKRNHDKKFKYASFQPGDKVMHEEFRYPNTHKFKSAYNGPYTVIRKISDVAYEISKPTPQKSSQIIHINQLRAYFEPEDFKLSTPQPRRSRIPIPTKIQNK